MSLPLLIDCDGVVCDFIGAVINYAKERWDIDIKYEDVNTDIRKHCGELWDDEAEQYIRSDGFAQGLQLIPGAMDAIWKMMHSANDVIFVTAPYIGSKTWDHDRRMWLKDRFCISRDQLIFAHNKKWVKGMTLIDDKYQNIIDWSNENKRTGILFEQPWTTPFIKDLEYKMENGNRWYQVRDGEKYSDFFAVKNWDEAMKALNSFAWYQSEKAEVYDNL